jgi:hypothetical protein
LRTTAIGTSHGFAGIDKILGRRGAMIVGSSMSSHPDRTQTKGQGRRTHRAGQLFNRREMRHRSKQR